MPQSGVERGKRVVVVEALAAPNNVFVRGALRLYATLSKPEVLE